MRWFREQGQSSKLLRVIFYFLALAIAACSDEPCAGEEKFLNGKKRCCGLWAGPEMGDVYLYDDNYPAAKAYWVTCKLPMTDSTDESPDCSKQ